MASLRKEISGMSEKMLFEHLNDLMDFRMVKKSHLAAIR